MYGITDEQIIATPKGRKSQGGTEKKQKNKISQLLLQNSAMAQAEISAKLARDEITLTQSGSRELQKNGIYWENTCKGF